MHTSHHLNIFRRAVITALLTLASVLVVVAPAAAAGSAPGAETDHCVANVIGRAADGELQLGATRCYASFAEAVSDATHNSVTLTPDATGEIMFTDAVPTRLNSFILGIHFDGYGGTGSSITITGTSCSGGYWNARGFWKNRINSSYNGCYNLRHYDYQNRSGAAYYTYGSGQIDNLGSFVNRTESVAYY